MATTKTVAKCTTKNSSAKPVGKPADHSAKGSDEREFQEFLNDEPKDSYWAEKHIFHTNPAKCSAFCHSLWTGAIISTVYWQVKRKYYCPS